MLQIFLCSLLEMCERVVMPFEKSFRWWFGGLSDIVHRSALVQMLEGILTMR